MPIWQQRFVEHPSSAWDGSRSSGNVFAQPQAILSVESRTPNWPVIRYSPQRLKLLLGFGDFFSLNDMLDL